MFEELWRTHCIQEYKYNGEGGPRVRRLVGFEVRAMTIKGRRPVVEFEPGECHYERFESPAEGSLRKLEAMKAEALGRGVGVGPWREQQLLSLKRKVRGEKVACTVTHLDSGLVETSSELGTYEGNRSRCERKIAAMLVLMEKNSYGDPEIGVDDEPIPNSDI